MPKPERSYTDLIVWQKAISLSVGVYKYTDSFPRQETYALTDQMRRAAVSIPSNIAEGRSRGTAKDFVHFLRIALGSAAELETQLIISKELGYGESAQRTHADALLTEIRKMLHVMIKKLETSG